MVKKKSSKFVHKTITIKEEHAKFISINSIHLSRFVQNKLDELLDEVERGN